MRHTWLIIDSSALAHRALHTCGALKYKGVGATGVLFQFFGAIFDLQREFSTEQMVFCFDSRRKHCKRRKIYPGYKKKRDEKKYTPEEQKMYFGMKKQIGALRRYLKQIGYQNVYYQKGHEADDLIASCVRNIRKRKDRAIIVSGDEDMYQLLSKRVSIWKPVAKKLYTHQSFKNEYHKIKPKDWAICKAVAGCSTDEVEGIDGIGEKSVAAYIAGNLRKGTVKHTLIRENYKRMCKRNLPLVQLPFAGTRRTRLVVESVKRLDHNAVFKELGFRSLIRS